jgi:hypothetical protein
MNKFLCFSLIMVAILFFSCGKRESTTPGTEQNLPTGELKDTVALKEQIEGSKSQTSSSPTNELGIVEGLPTDYPADVPKPLNADSVGTIKSSDETSVRYFTPDMPKVVVDYFAKGLEKSGFKKAEGESMKEEGGMVIWNKDKREVSLMLARDKDKNRTAVVVSYK